MALLAAFDFVPCTYVIGYSLLVIRITSNPGEIRFARLPLQGTSWQAFHRAGD
jgi:hypothetical protein